MRMIFIPPPLICTNILTFRSGLHDVDAEFLSLFLLFLVNNRIPLFRFITGVVANILVTAPGSLNLKTEKNGKKRQEEIRVPKSALTVEYDQATLETVVKRIVCCYLINNGRDDLSDATVQP